MKILNVSELGAAVRAARTSRSMTQAQLAEIAQVTREWVGRLEKGHPRLEIEKVFRAISSVGITVEMPEIVPTPKDIEKAESIAWTMALEAQNVRPEAYERLVQRIAARRAKASV